MPSPDYAMPALAVHPGNLPVRALIRATSAAADTDTSPRSTASARDGVPWTRTVAAARTLHSETFNMLAASAWDTGFERQLRRFAIYFGEPVVTTIVACRKVSLSRWGRTIRAGPHRCPVSR